MATRLILKRYTDWFQPGSTSDSRLLHSDKSDRILVCPDYLGQGYCQKIELREDLTLEISDYTLKRDLVIEEASSTNLLAFHFYLASRDAGYSFPDPSFGFKGIGIERSHQRKMYVHVVFRYPTLIKYFKSYMANLSPQTYLTAERVIKFLYQYHNGYSISSTVEMVDWVLHNANASNTDRTLEQVLIDDVFSGLPALECVLRNPISDSMKQVIGQILSCPYQGANRRAYLEQKALKLVALYLEAVLRSHLNKFDLDCIYQAEAILKDCSVNPPTIETLARQIGTNRFKLNQGFQQVYGMTPYGYLRYYRLLQAKRLLMTSELSIEEAAAIVGYKSRSHFAIAFRQQFGINPKIFQMQAWKCAS